MRITLCGSTRFRKQYEEVNRRLSKQGHVVYSVSCFGHDGDPLTDQEKVTLDRVHLAKIDNSDAIVVLNVDNYIGESTSREIAHAKATGKDIYYLDGRAGGRAICPYAGCRDSLLNSPPCDDIKATLRAGLEQRKEQRARIQRNYDEIRKVLGSISHPDALTGVIEDHERLLKAQGHMQEAAKRLAQVLDILNAEAAVTNGPPLTPEQEG